jgi:hypothetical protein
MGRGYVKTVWEKLGLELKALEKLLPVTRRKRVF